MKEKIEKALGDTTTKDAIAIIALTLIVAGGYAFFVSGSPSQEEITTYLNHNPSQRYNYNQNH